VVSFIKILAHILKTDEKMLTKMLIDLIWSHCDLDLDLWPFNLHLISSSLWPTAL